MANSQRKMKRRYDEGKQLLIQDMVKLVNQIADLTLDQLREAENAVVVSQQARDLQMRMTWYNRDDEQDLITPNATGTLSEIDRYLINNKLL